MTSADLPGLDARAARSCCVSPTGMGDRGHIRCVATVSDAEWAAGVPGLTVVHLRP